MTTPYYEDEWVTLYHGDCREVAAWLDADILVTDPPYGVRRHSNEMHYTPTAEAKRDVIAGDKTPEIRDAALALWGTRPAVVFGSWRVPRPPRTNQRLIWYKAASKPAHMKHAWYSSEEEIYVIGTGFEGTPAHNVITTREARSGGDGLAATVGHPTPKPVGLMEHLISRCPAGAIADPFAGSGSTLIAAKALGRHAIGVEAEERYCEIAANRLSQDVLFGGAA